MSIRAELESRQSLAAEMTTNYVKVGYGNLPIADILRDFGAEAKEGPAFATALGMSGLCKPEKAPGGGWRRLKIARK